MGRPDKAARAAIARRRADAIDLHLAGVDWVTVGRKLAADPTVNSDRIAYPQGYGIERYTKGLEPPDDKQLIHAACKDVRLALKERTTDLAQKVEELRAVDNLRLTACSSSPTGRLSRTATFRPSTARCASSNAAPA
ncbi:hypothetical protein ABZY09_43345 [Streptomyces sp. NPDC002928]|uniref:hypothetical protein n=1 Tax=Streptomyces sp. NPDC002928 TaxID=3154440 RepID=UPI0033AC2118